MDLDREGSRYDVFFGWDGRKPETPDIPEQPRAPFIEDGVNKLLCEVLIFIVTGRRSSFSQDFSLLVSAFSLLISLGVVTKNLP